MRTSDEFVWLSMRHTGKAFIINEGGPGDPPNWSLVSFHDGLGQLSRQQPGHFVPGWWRR